MFELILKAILLKQNNNFAKNRFQIVQIWPNNINNLWSNNKKKTNHIVLLKVFPVLEVNEKKWNLKYENISCNFQYHAIKKLCEIGNRKLST